MPSLQNKKVLLAVVVAVLVVLGGVTYWFFGKRGSLSLPQTPIQPSPAAPSEVPTSNEATSTQQ